MCRTRSLRRNKLLSLKIFWVDFWYSYIHTKGKHGRCWQIKLLACSDHVKPHVFMKYHTDDINIQNTETWCCTPECQVTPTDSSTPVSGRAQSGQIPAVPLPCVQHWPQVPTFTGKPEQPVPVLSPSTCYSISGFPSRKGEFTEAQDNTWHLECTLGAAPRQLRRQMRFLLK